MWSGRDGYMDEHPLRQWLGANHVSTTSRIARAPCAHTTEARSADNVTKDSSHDES